MREVECGAEERFDIPRDCPAFYRQLILDCTHPQRRERCGAGRPGPDMLADGIQAPDAVPGCPGHPGRVFALHKGRCSAAQPATQRSTLP